MNPEPGPVSFGSILGGPPPVNRFIIEIQEDSNIVLVIIPHSDHYQVGVSPKLYTSCARLLKAVVQATSAARQRQTRSTPRVQVLQE